MNNPPVLPPLSECNANVKADADIVAHVQQVSELLRAAGVVRDPAELLWIIAVDGYLKGLGDGIQLFASALVADATVSKAQEAR